MQVPMASYIVRRAPEVIATRGVGSCVVVTAYNPSQKIGGLAHYMLPHLPKNHSAENPNRFADYVVPRMIEEVRSMSGSDYLEAKIIGGADLFPMLAEGRQTGEENAQIARQILIEARASIVGEHVGGNFGRSVEFDLETGVIEVIVRL